MRYYLIRNAATNDAIGLMKLPADDVAFVSFKDPVGGRGFSFRIPGAKVRWVVDCSGPDTTVEDHVVQSITDYHKYKRGMDSNDLSGTALLTFRTPEVMFDHLEQAEFETYIAFGSLREMRIQEC